ncbi:unnamed protein product [Medioppia subpectinata]|uniref:rhomboid protease n=1 Tax=Medioppia subpectinata TaxID=1979941 RepID=A0A7R9L0A1_9ACAR|nr:unnamed protein product [Medioppia subpectinata]CAG2112045.1 unnamed protein product [Medioppia subpectinata]
MISMFRSNQWLLNANKCLKVNTKGIALKDIGRSFTKKVMTRNDNLVDNPNMKSLVKPFLFTVGFSGTVYTVSIVYNYENSLSRLPFSKWKRDLHSFQDNYGNRKAGTLRNELNQWWNSRTTGFKVFSSIAAINILVFIGWKIPRLQHFMSKHFMTYTTSNGLKCWPMLWSTFSHYSPTHLIFNLIVLHSFTQLGVNAFGTEQFIALYLSSGVISSFGSYLAKVLTKKSAASLGASGAILGILSSCCIARPELELVIIFLPFFTISAGMALKGIILMDSAGLVLGWKLFDHGAHLAGTLFGIWYATNGLNVISQHKPKCGFWFQGLVHTNAKGIEA